MLAATFLERAGGGRDREGLRLSSATLAAMMRHPWPGNVRELRTAMEYASIHARGGEVREEDLPPEILRSSVAPPVWARGIHPQLPPVEDAWGPGASGAPLDPRERVIWALRQAKGNRKRAAAVLGVSRATLYRRLEALDLDPDEV